MDDGEIQQKSNYLLILLEFILAQSYLLFIVTFLFYFYSYFFILMSYHDQEKENFQGHLGMRMLTLFHRVQVPALTILESQF